MSLIGLPFGLFAVFALPVLAPGASTIRTPKGREAWSRLGGFRRVLSTPSSEARFDFSGRKELYTAYIPWAVAFGCAREWAEKYRVEAQEEPPVPGYYIGGYPGMYGGGRLHGRLRERLQHHHALGHLVVPGHADLVLGRRRRGVLRWWGRRRRRRRLVVTANVPVDPGEERNQPMWIAVIVIAVVVIGLVVFVISGFNRLRTTDIAAQEAIGGVDVQLTRRADLIPNLVNTVKGYAAHERGVFEAVTAARTRASAAAKGNDVGEKAAADQQLSQALVNVMAVAEAYPDLKASPQFLDLQRQLGDTENQISFARQYYNDAVTKLNTMVSTIPWMFLVGMAGVSRREFYEAPEGQDAAPRVDFGTDPPPTVGTTYTPAPGVPPASAAPQVDSAGAVRPPPGRPAG